MVYNAEVVERLRLGQPESQPKKFRGAGYTASVLVKTYQIEVDAQPECHVIDLTAEVETRVSKSGLSEGQVTVFNVGSTAGVTTIEYEPGLIRDLKDLFDRLAPAHRDYHHEQAWHDGNGFSHMRASLLKPSLTVPVVAGRMQLGTWQQIVLVNFDNRPRRRKVIIQAMGAAQ